MCKLNTESLQCNRITNLVFLDERATVLVEVDTQSSNYTVSLHLYVVCLYQKEGVSNILSLLYDN